MIRRPTRSTLVPYTTLYRSRRKPCAFCVEKTDDVDYNAHQKLRTFISDRGKILPRRTTGTCAGHQRDRKRTRLNSSHANISYAVFSLNKYNHCSSTSPLLHV